MADKLARLDKLEQSLTPKQAVLLWMEEALQHQSCVELAQSYKGKSVAEFPLSVLGKQMEASARAAHKGAKPEVLGWAIREAQKEATFLWYLWSNANGKVAEERASFARASLLMHEKLEHLIERLYLNERMNEAWRRACEQPYPLDGETAAAVHAASAHYIETWASFDESGLVQDWVTEAYEAEGKTALPFWAPYARDGQRAPRGIPLPTLEEVQAIFGDEERFQQWLQEEDYRFGLADVPDAIFLARCDAVDAEVHRLVDEGTVAQGWSVLLDTVPMAFLREAPLVDGKWIDAYVVELAEWGALLQKKGLTFKEVDDNSPYALDRIGKVTKDGFVEADDDRLWKHRDAVRANLASLPGRTRNIEERRYLHFDDYAAWKGRTVKGKLERQPGILASAWTAWRARDAAVVNGVPLGAITCWAANEPYSVHEAGRGRQLARERVALLDALRAWTLHDFDQEPGYFARRSPLRKRTLLEEAKQWREMALTFALPVISLERTLSRVAEHYFDGRPLLLEDERQNLDHEVEFLEVLVREFNDVVATECTMEGTPGVPPIDLEQLKADTEEHGTQRAAFFVDLAKADALRALDEDNAAADLMAKYV